MRTNKKMILAALFTAALIVPGLLFAGVTTEKAGGKQLKILFIPFTMEHVFQKELCDGSKIPVLGFDAQVIVEDPYGKIEKELEILETYINCGIDAVIMYPIDSKALIPVVQEYKKKGIWVFTTGNHVQR
jgi:ribose transport system substrate-binding protein